MNARRWSSLYRTYDISLRYNQVLLFLTGMGAVLGFALESSSFRSRVLATGVAAFAVFIAGALAKEMEPDRPQAAIAASLLTIPAVWAAPALSVPAAFWLLGCIRLINRTTGLPPRLTDILLLLAITGGLTWLYNPLFGTLMGSYLIADSLLSEGRRSSAVMGGVVLAASSAWLMLRGDPATGLGGGPVTALLIIAVAFIPVILNTYHVVAVGDATGQPLDPTRVQAGQAVGLSAGLFFASCSGMSGITLFIALWASLLGIIGTRALTARIRRSTATL